jgi:indole-3-glycerol phosphate synthase
MTTNDLLQRIVARRRERFGVSPTPQPPRPFHGAVASSSSSSKANPFLAALGAARGRAVIAEVKMGSPRLGTLAGRFDPLEQAAA